jgi:DNA-binding PadR family transcriptional regulator
MHPYRMQRLIRDRGKDQVINVGQRASLYQTIGQLENAGLIQVRKTVRSENRPDRTIYELTASGYHTIQEWLREALATPAREFPEFPAAVSFMPLLEPSDVLHQLEKREHVLVEKLSSLSAEMHTARGLPRLFLLEGEYLLAMLETELRWVRGILDDLRSERLTWNDVWLSRFMPPDMDSEG